MRRYGIVHDRIIPSHPPRAQFWVFLLLAKYTYRVRRGRPSQRRRGRSSAKSQLGQKSCNHSDMTDTPLLSEATLFPTSTMSTVEGTEENNHKAEVPNPTVGEHHLHQHQHQHPNGAVKVVGDESAGTDVQQQVGGGGDGEGEKNALMNGNGIEGETSDVNGEEEAPTLVEAPKSANDGKLMKELDDEAPKTFPQVVRTNVHTCTYARTLLFENRPHKFYAIVIQLMDILSNEEDSDTISWLPHGRSFIIYKKKKFAANVLPKFFKATKFTSFTRKLNRWGFTRVTRGPEVSSTVWGSYSYWIILF